MTERQFKIAIAFIVLVVIVNFIALGWVVRKVEPLPTATNLPPAISTTVPPTITLAPTETPQPQQ